MKRLSILLLCAALLLCGCGYEPVVQDTRAAFVCYDDDGAYGTAMTDGIRDAMGSGTLDVYSLSGNAFVEDMLAAKIIAEGYDVVFIRSSGSIQEGEGGTVAYHLMNAEEIGAVVVVEQGMTNDANQIVQRDDEAAGALSMAQLAENMGEHGQVLLLSCDSDYYGKIRLRGAKEACDAYDDISLLEYTQFDIRCLRGETPRLMRDRVRQETHDYVAEQLSSGEQIDGIWAMSEYMALGAVQALDEAGLLGQIPVVCVGANDEVLQAIQAGEILCCAASDPYALGVQSFELYAYPDRTKLFWGRKTTCLSPVLIDADNAAVYLPMYD